MFNDLNLYLCLGQVSCFDGDGSGGDEAAAAAAAAKAAEAKVAADAAAKAAAAGNTKTFKQDDVNRIVEERLARERKQNSEKYRELETSYSTLLESQGLSEEERGKMEENLADVQKKLRTKEEDAKFQLKKVKDAHVTELSEAKESAKVWEERFYTSSIDRALQDAASSNEAYNNSQIVSLLRPMTKLKPKLDDAGKETNDFETVIDFPDIDDKGIKVITQRTPEDTVKRMKEIDDYANLFKSNVVSGVGGNSVTGGHTPGSDGQIDVTKLTIEQYAQIRRDKPELLGLKD